MNKLVALLMVMSCFSIASIVTTEVYKDSDITLKIERIQPAPKVVTVSVDKLVNVYVDKIVTVDRIVPDKVLIQENKDLRESVEYVVSENEYLMNGYTEIGQKALEIKFLASKYYGVQDSLMDVPSSMFAFEGCKEVIEMQKINNKFIADKLEAKREWYDDNLLWFIIGMFVEKIVKF